MATLLWKLNEVHSVRTSAGASNLSLACIEGPFVHTSKDSLNSPNQPFSDESSEATSLVTISDSAFLRHRSEDVLLPTDPKPQSITKLNGDQEGAESSTLLGRLSLLKHLKSDRCSHDLDLKMNYIITWINTMELARHGLREKHLAGVLPDIDCVFDSLCLPGGNPHAPRGQPSKNPLSRRSEKSRRPGGKSRTSGNRNRKLRLDKISVGLACPFPKHDRRRYEFVDNPCTKPFGFPTPGKLVEHLNRVHSLSWSCCIPCKLRFNDNTRADREEAKREHEEAGQCVPRELALSEPEWMDEEQNTRFDNLTLKGQTTSAGEKWKNIYCCLFPDTDLNNIPDPSSDSRHLNDPQTSSQEVNNFATHLPSSIADFQSSPQQVAHQPTLNLCTPALSFEQTTQYTQDAESSDTMLKNNLGASPQFKSMMQMGSSIRPIEPGSMAIGESYSPSTLLQTGCTYNLNAHVSDSAAVNNPNVTHPQTAPTASPTMLTGKALAENDECLSQGGLPYAVYRSEDSGYQSLEQAKGLPVETAAGRPIPQDSSIGMLPETLQGTLQPQLDSSGPGMDPSHNDEPYLDLIGFGTGLIFDPQICCAYRFCPSCLKSYADHG